MKFFKDNHPKKITILLGHEDVDSLCGQFALLYETAAKQAGHEVKRFNLGQLKFDPQLHHGYKVIQELEPDLKALQEAITWSDHFVVLYPNWWSTMPALLKGLFDRMWLPHFCFAYYKTGLRGHLGMWQKMMRGKTARVFVLSGSHPLLIWLFIGDYTNEIGRGILWFAGFKTRITRLGPSEKAPEWKKDEWRKKIARMGAHAE